MAELERLRAENVELRRDNQELRREVADVRAENEDLRTLVSKLETRIAELERRLNKNSSNSSKPPSTDDDADRDQRQAEAAERAAKNRPASKKVRRPGKQRGVKGKHLARVEPDHTIVHAPLECSDCGSTLDDAPVTGRETRQVLDFPERSYQATDHVVEKRRCGCGTETKAEFPPEALAPVCWGPRIAAFTLYLLVCQHLPHKRTAELLREFLGAHVSTGWVAKQTLRYSGRLKPFLTSLKDHLAGAYAAHVDETGTRVKGVKHWVHVMCTEMLTYLFIHKTRGREALDPVGILDRFKQILIHDRWVTYWQYDEIKHGLCGAHLLRDLKDAGIWWQQEQWTKAMAKLLTETNKACHRARDENKQSLSTRRLNKLSADYDAIVADALAANPDLGRKRTQIEKDAYNLACAFQKRKNEILLFAYDLRIDFTNNQAERDLRMVKVGLKITGGHRNLKVAEGHLEIRSYVETGRKHGENRFALLERLVRNNPWTIPNQAGAATAVA
jgi:transposase